MLSLTRSERRAPRFINDNFDLDDLYAQLDSLRNYVTELSASVGQDAGRRFARARGYASEAAREAEETMKDNLAASLILAVGVGVLVGYFLRRRTE
jgi:hypothetical protein